MFVETSQSVRRRDSPCSTRFSLAAPRRFERHSPQRDSSVRPRSVHSSNESDIGRIYLLFSSEEAVAQPSTCCSISTDVGEGLAMLTIRSTERDFVNGLIEKERLVAFVGQPKSVARDVQEDLLSFHFVLEQSVVHRETSLDHRYVQQRANGLFAEMHPPRFGNFHTAEILDDRWIQRLNSERERGNCTLTGNRQRARRTARSSSCQDAGLFSAFALLRKLNVRFNRSIFFFSSPVNEQDPRKKEDRWRWIRLVVRSSNEKARIVLLFVRVTRNE